MEGVLKWRGRMSKRKEDSSVHKDDSAEQETEIILRSNLFPSHFPGSGTV